MITSKPDQLHQNHCVLLAEVLQLSRFLSSDRHEDILKQRHQQRLLSLQDALKEIAHPISRNLLPLENIPLKVRRAFVQAAVLLDYYRSLGAATWSGTFSLPSLEHYVCDDLSVKTSSEKEIVRLCEIFQVSDEFKTYIHSTISAIETKIERQKQVIATIIADAGILVGGQSASREAATVLFQRIFGGVPMPSEAVDIIYTDTQIYFCIDYQDHKLRSPEHWQQLSTVEQEKLSSFLQTVSEFTFKKFRHFPTFSLCDLACIDLNWCDRIAEAVGASRSQIAQILSISISILPTHKSEKFLVHDIWGHNWQLALTQFKGDYMLLAHCDEPLRAAETAYTAHGPLTCRELFNVEQNQVKLDREKARLFFQGEVQQRLGLMFTHLIGELIADVAEFKFIWNNPNLSQYLPNSSIFKDIPAKVDLGLADIDFLFLKILKPLLEVQVSVFEESVLETNLIDQRSRRWPDEISLDFSVSLKQAILELSQVFLEEYQANCLPKITGELNIYTQMVINLLQLQHVINDLCSDATIKGSDQISFHVLIPIFIGCYCSGDSFTEFWEIDNVIANYFLPCFWQLSENL